VTWQDFERAFWERVQVCRHGRSCRRCCWEWLGKRGRDGYGVVRVPRRFALWPIGPRGHMRCNEVAHRLALELGCGAGLFDMRRLLVRHLCHHPPCCNYHHLRPGTPGDNWLDTLKEKDKAA
jgi:hypothetical protein